MLYGTKYGLQHLTREYQFELGDRDLSCFFVFVKVLYFSHVLRFINVLLLYKN